MSSYKYKILRIVIYLCVLTLIFRLEPRIWTQMRRDYENKTRWMAKVYNLDIIPTGYNVGLFYPKICSDILYAIAGKFAEGKIKTITQKIKNFHKDFKKRISKSIL